MVQRHLFNLYLARTVGMLSGARRTATMLLVTLLLTMTAQTAWAQQTPIDIGGIVYELYGDNPDNRTATVVLYVDPNDNIVIPSTVEYNNENYTVTSIGPGAFCDCGQLSMVVFEPGSQLESIGDNAFGGCESLESITIPASVTSIGSGAFNACSQLRMVEFEPGSQLESIGDGAFAGCESLESITIPDGVTSIGGNAFSGCVGLQEINVADENSEYCSEDGVLFNKDKTILIKYPVSKPGVDYDDVTYYFIPSSVETVAEGAFDEGLGLTIFYHNESLSGEQYIFIPTIHYDPDEVTVKGMPIQIDGIDYYPEGTTITLIPTHAISSIIIKNISNDEDVTESFLQGLTLTMPAYDVIVDVELADVTGNFGNNGDLTWTMSDVNEDGTYETLTISGTGEMDGGNRPWEDAFKSTITTIVISDGVTNIHDGTFYQYPNLTTVTIGSGVTSIGAGAFNECTSLATITFGENSQLTTIGENAFYHCAISEIAIPAGVTSIGESAFNECTSLASVNFGNNSQLTTIGGSAFNGCTSLVSITIPDGVTSVGSDAFGNTPWFENEENQENGIVYVGKVAYEWKGSATSAVIKDGTVAIAPSAFTGASITSVTIPDGVTTIGEQAFNASHLTSITIPASVTSIGDYAFLSCSGLASVYVLPTIPPTLGHDPFYYCNVLSAIVVPTAAYDTYYNATDWNSYQSILKPATCTVTLDRQDGSGDSDEVTATYGEAMPDIAVPTRTGYDFKGYFTETGGNGTKYYNADGTSARTWDLAAATTLYAKWTAKQSTVRLEKEGGENGSNEVTATYGAPMPQATMPTREGYTFGGYFTEPNGNGTQYYNVDGTSARTWNITDNNLTLYAYWKKDLSNADITIEIPAQTYNGSQLTPEITVKDGDAVVSAEHYDIILPDGRTNAGDYTIEIHAKEGSTAYAGSKTETFTISKAPLTVTAKDHSIFYGNAVANNGVVYDGFVNGEGENVLEGELTYSYTNDNGDFREDNNAPGEYDIIPSGLTSANYAITFVPGTLTVKPVIVKFIVDIANGEPLAGIHVIVRRKTDNIIIHEWNSTIENYVHEINVLKAGGEYSIVGSENNDYTSSADYTLTIDENGNVSYSGTITEGGVLLIENAKKVKVSVVDIADGEEIEGAHVQVIDSEGNVVKEWDSTTLPHVIEGLATGEEYTLKETVAPEGYALSTESTFTIDASGVITTTGTKITDEEGHTVLLIENSKTKVKISVVNIADEEELLEGAHVQVLDSEGKVVDEWDSTTEPHEIEGLATGEEYTLKETVAPEGYALSTESTFTIGTNGTITFSGIKTTDGVLLIENNKTKVPYIDADGNPADCTDYTEIDGSETSFGPGWYVVNGNISLPMYGSLAFCSSTAGAVHLIIADGASLTINAMGEGIKIGENSSLTIYGQANSTGTINVSSDAALAISAATGGSLTINGGSVTASGNNAGFSIGGNVCINSGTVTATANNASGISASGNITINGGSVTASGYNNGINASCNITINGGSVTAKSSNCCINATGSITLNDGTIEATDVNNSGINATGGITLGGAIVTAKDYIGTVTIADGKAYTDGISNYFGTLTNEEKAAIANKTLHPVTGVTLTKDVSGEITASLDPSSEEEVSIPVAVEVDHVEVDRTYESGKASTVYLPFSIPVTNVSGGKFHTFTDVDEKKDPWEVIYTEVTSGDIAANTPYIFLPDGTNEGKIVVNNGTDKVSVSTANPKTTTQGLWEFIGTYERIKWTHDTTDPEYTAAREAEIGSVYGFAANDSGTDRVGDFVKVGNNVWINPMRAYLKRSTSPGARTMTSDGQAQQLPDKMRVVIISASGETNEIGTLDIRTGEMTFDEWYSLDGHKLNGKPTKKGVYIKNGNKVVIKN